MVTSVIAVVALVGLALALAGTLAHRLQLPTAVGYVAVGVAASPHALGAGLVPEELIDAGAELGVLFILFLIGLELDLKRLTSAVRSGAALLPFDVLLPAALLFSLGRLVGWTVTESLALGLALAVSSTLFGERLTSMRHVPPKARERVLGVLVTEDVAAAALLAILVGLAGGSASGSWMAPLEAMGLLVFALIVVAGLGLLVFPRFLDAITRMHQHELVVLLTVALVLGAGYAGHLVGSAELGALAAGVVAAEAGSRYLIRNSLSAVRDLALAVFFLATGMAVDIGQLAASPFMAFAVAGVFLTAKLLVHVPAATGSGLRLVDSLGVGFALGTIGEFSLILLAVAEDGGIAHATMRSTVVGALLILLVVSPLILLRAEKIAAFQHRLPAGARNLGVWVVQAMRRAGRGAGTQGHPLRRHARRLLANLLVLAGLLFITAWAVPRLQNQLSDVNDGVVAVGVLGLTLAVAFPLLRGGYRAYRDMVWSVVGLRPGERAGAGRVRTRIVDAVVAFSAVLVLIPVTLSAPFTWPVLAVGAVLAAVVAALAWRQLVGFHNALETAISRVLGHETEATDLLDRAMRQYPWGVRVVGVGIPPDSPIARQTLRGSRLAELTGVLVAVIQRRGKEIVNPRPDQVLLPGDTLVFMGEPAQIEHAEALVVSHGEALRLTAQSRLAEVEEVTVETGSQWADDSLGAVDVRGSTGALVVGVCRPGERERPRRYDPTLILIPGTRLILLGTALQMARARRLAGHEQATATEAD